MKHITDFIVVRREQLGRHYFSLTLRHPTQLPPIAAGQFGEVEVRNCREVMLRRPISIHDVNPQENTLTLLIQIVGKGTQQLSTLKQGNSLNLIYPLGRGFSLQGSNPLLVGGGAGIAPLLYLTKCYKDKGVTPTVLLGGRTKELIPVREAFEPYGKVLYATEDGSLGEHGLVTQHPLFTACYDHICTCGPTPMMKAVGRYAIEKGVPCEVSLENMMACGIGACLCCVTDTDEGHKCVCKEGPVFDVSKMCKWLDIEKR
ncbi:MAG: dihydroorotate dehydrogenase electron transfer subunit [Bacteroidales bacterium]|nr:dihydroorotate dehydrogenase electron transfer subunit [Bacteroidales bacterium]